MSKEARQVLFMIMIVGLELGALWAGVTLFSSDMQQRNDCYQKGVEGLPQGVDQTLLQTQSKAYTECLQK